MTNRLKHIFECSDHITEKQYRNSIGTVGHFLSLMDAHQRRFLQLLPVHFYQDLHILWAQGLRLPEL